MSILLLLTILGVFLSLYALIVELRLKNKEYTPLCDISELVSCSKAFLSPYGRLFGFPNPLIGIVAYLVLIYLIQTEAYRAVFLLSSLGVLFSFYLGYISYVRLRNFCIICTCIYIINLLLFFFSWKMI